MDSIPDKLVAASIQEMLDSAPDLVLEAAHPEAVRKFGRMVLEHADLMIMSVSAMGDSALEQGLRETALSSGHRLFIPHGATLGLDGLRDGLSLWEEVCITMRKSPRNLDFQAAPHLVPPENAAEAILYDGPTRGILGLFPKNVNSHATLALATMGLDRTRSVLVADRSLDASVIEISASGGGTSIYIERRNPIKGVTGTLTILSVLESIKSALSLEECIKIC